LGSNCGNPRSLTQIEQEGRLVHIISQSRYRLLEAECLSRLIQIKYLCDSMPEGITYVEKPGSKRGFGLHQVWHGLRVALDSGLHRRVLCSDCAPSLIFPLLVLLMDWIFCRLWIATASPSDCADNELCILSSYWYIPVYTEYMRVYTIIM
jgi:hypothetical protein